jgi:glycosyltransferase involved in cell wall biosynthesis
MEAAVAIRSVRVSVVIPALNEAENLPHVFPRLPDGLHEVIIVDGRSTDGTVEVARRLRPDVRIVKQDGKGKGNALAAGFAAATGDIFVTLDADGSTDAAEIPRFVSALCNGADFVKGSRFAQGGASSDITFTRRLGNRGLNALVNALYGTSYTDLCYGYFTSWHTAGVEWTPGKLVYTLDGEPWATVRSRHVPREPMELAMQAQAGTCGHRYAPCPDATTSARVNMQIHWVRAYAYG